MMATLSYLDGRYLLTPTGGAPVDLGTRRPTRSRQLKALGAPPGADVPIVDLAPPPTPRNRNRSHKVAAGLVAVEIWMTPEQRDLLDAYARTVGLSRNACVVEWVRSRA